MSVVPPPLPPSGAPCPNNDNQIALEDAVGDYNTGSAMTAAAYNSIASALELMMALWASGNLDAAMMVGEEGIIGGEGEASNDETIMYAASQLLAAALAGFVSSDEELFNTGSDPDQMTYDDALELNEDWTDLWYDLNSGMLDMVDDSATKSLSDSMTHILKQYGYDTDPNQNIPLEPDDVQYSTNTWFYEENQTTSDGATPPPPQQIVDIENDYEAMNNTVNGQQSSAASLEANQVDESNTYNGDLSDMFNANIELLQTINHNLKG